MEPFLLALVLCSTNGTLRQEWATIRPFRLDLTVRLRHAFPVWQPLAGQHHVSRAVAARRAHSLSRPAQPCTSAAAPQSTPQQCVSVCLMRRNEAAALGFRAAVWSYANLANHEHDKQTLLTQLKSVSRQRWRMIHSFLPALAKPLQEGRHTTPHRAYRVVWRQPQHRLTHQAPRPPHGLRAIACSTAHTLR